MYRQSHNHVHTVNVRRFGAYICEQLVEVGMVLSEDLVTLETMLAFIERHL